MWKKLTKEDPRIQETVLCNIAENGVKKFFSRSPEPSLVAPCEEEEEEEEESSSGEEESEQSVAPLKPGRSPTSS